MNSSRQNMSTGCVENKLFTTRWAGIIDVDSLVSLFDGYRQFYEKPSDINYCIQFLSDRLSREESKIALAEDAGGDVLGFIQLYPLFTSLALSSESVHTWLLNDLFVMPSVRKLGVASKLLEFVQDFVEQTRANHMMLETSRVNFPAQRLYERHGWLRDEIYFVYHWQPKQIK